MIEVENLGKRYRLGGLDLKYRTLREDIVRAVRSPFSKKTPRVEEWFWALKDVSFRVGEGEAVGVIGRNGAGKSTLLKILSRITPPTEGRARLRGRVGSLLEVGTGFHPELTGRENIFLSGAVMGMSRAETLRKFDEIVAFAEIEKFVDTPVKHYSSGMYVRLGFSVAAHLEPEILLVDEVLAVGDTAFRRKCGEHLQKVGRSGLTIILVSHNMAQIRRLCRKAIWIDDGGIEKLGDAAEVSLEYEARSVHRPSEEGGGVFVRSGPHDPDVWVEGAEMRSGAGDLCTEFRYGDEMLLDFRLAYGPDFEKRGLRNLALAYILTDEGDLRLSAEHMISLRNYFDGGVRRVRCRIGPLPLYKGSYKLQLAVTHETHGRIDTWADGVAFSVVHCDPYGRGWEWDRRSGFFHVPTSWEIPDSPPAAEDGTEK